jgi:type IV pilus assembly protein PilF
MFLWCIAGISGCATKANESTLSSEAGEIVTESDEPEARKRARIRLELAVGYFEQGQTTVALDELKKSIAADPSYSDAYSFRGLIYMQLNDFRFAEDSFKKALSIHPQDSNVLHNLAWLLCQQARYPAALELFTQVLANPQYSERAKTFRAQGLCQVRYGLIKESERSFLNAFELDVDNPITAYNLSKLLFQRQDYGRSQFYIRRLNNSDLANSESLWLGIKVEKMLDNRSIMLQLGAQLMKRFPQSREASAYQRNAFDE